MALIGYLQLDLSAASAFEDIADHSFEMVSGLALELSFDVAEPAELVATELALRDRVVGVVVG